MTRLIPILPAGQARRPSTRTRPCGQADTCARALVPLSDRRPSEDYSRGARPCVYFVALTRPAAAASSPTVHDAPGWLP